MMTNPKNLEELKTTLIKMAGLFIDEMENEENVKLAQFYLIQSRTCVAISKDLEKLKRLFESISDGENTLADITNL